MTASTAASLEALISHDRLRLLAGEASFARGQAYFSGWQVRSVRYDGSYQSLEQHAERGGQCPAWRDKALACIRERLASGAREQGTERRGVLSWAPSWTDRSVLVEIFLWEGDADGAWREAKEGGCSRQLWLQLAARRERAHPQDALAVYREQIPMVLAQTGTSAYHEAVGFLRKIQDLLAALGTAEEFARYTAELRALHRRKRNFIKLLDKQGW